VTGDANTAVRFDGASDDVAIRNGTGLNPRSRLTLEAWIKPARLPLVGHRATVLRKSGSWQLALAGPNLEFAVTIGGVVHRLTTAKGSIRAGVAYDVAATYDGAYQRLYVNGVLLVKRRQTGSIAGTTTAVTIASRDGSSARFSGTIDEVAVYSKALGGSRVLAHATTGRMRPKPTPSPTPTPTQIPISTPTAIPAAALRTGMAAHFMWQSLADTIADLDRMRAARMTDVRFDFSWKNSEATKGTYLYFDKLDQVLDAVAAHGLRATITVIETPGWANGGGATFAPPSNPADYARFIGALASHNAGRPNMTWEIWNEPNDAHFWTTGPNAAGYTAMLKAAYAAIKANDPDATVLGGSIVFNDTPFLRGIYASGGGSSFDGLSIHPYAKSYAPASTADPWFSFAASVPQFTKVMADNGQPAKPIWITEMGWSTADVSDATRATYLPAATTIARGWTNVRALDVYTLHQSQYAEYGLLTTSGTPTLSWTAYAAAQ
jgi:hypothetical protein